ncbi:MAG: polysaccharide lyase [Solirubrobacteraceae bacterium]|nr:polysaccharide lyase [Solirubrobacteraceae bacterium]
MPRHAATPEASPASPRRRRTRLALLAAAVVAVASGGSALVASAATERLFSPRYHSTDGAATPNKPFAGWTGAQVPTSGNATLTNGKSNRLGVVANPKRNRIEKARYVLRAELQQGDVTNTGGLKRPRAEVLHTADKGNPGDLRYYAFSLRLGPFPMSTNGKLWTIVTQWKGENGGEPPMAIQVYNGRLKLVRVMGSVQKYKCASNPKDTCTKLAGATRNEWDLGKAPVNKWTRFVFQIRWSQGPDGRLCVRRDGHTIKCIKRLRTLQVYTPDGPGAADPVFLKQGLYRSDDWTVQQVAYFGPMVIADNARSAGWSKR